MVTYIATYFTMQSYTDYRYEQVQKDKKIQIPHLNKLKLMNLASSH